MMQEPYDCERCGTTYDEACGEGYCGLCPDCADQDEERPDPATRSDVTIYGAGSQ